MNQMSLFSHIKENWSSIWKGLDLWVALLITAIFVCCIIREVFIIQCIDIELDMCPVYEFIDLLFPTLIGALATIIAFAFAGLIFLVSFDYDDKFTPLFAYNDAKSYRQFSFHIRWLAAIGCFGIVTSVCTIFMKYFGCESATLIFFILSLFLFIYVITSVISLYSLLTVYGKLRLEFFDKIQKGMQSSSNSDTKNQEEKQ